MSPKQPILVGRRKNALEHIMMSQFADIYKARYGSAISLNYDRRVLAQIGNIDLVMKSMREAEIMKSFGASIEDVRRRYAYVQP